MTAYLIIISIFLRTCENKWVEWSVPKNSNFIVDGVSIRDVLQADMGDCWFIASIAAAAGKNKLLNQVIMPEINTKKNSDGYFFKLFKLGNWVTYRVDKELPNMRMESWRRNNADKETWVAYLEKV